MAQEEGSRNGLRLVRAVVSKKKTRFNEQGFDLDLTYITKQIIAMGFPSVGTEAMYRNPLPEVLKFFTFFHPGNYKVYNLCIEKNYPPNTFFLQGYFPHADHNPPPFKTLVAFCEDARNFMQENPSHVLAVHCKAGKGRTGTAIASYLCMQECSSAQEAMNLFGKARTKNNKGITIPSQQRYVMYYDAYVKNYLRLNKPFPSEAPTLRLKSFVLKHCPNIDVGGGCIPYFKIFVHGEKKPRYNMRKHQKVVPWKNKEKEKEIQREFKFSGGEGFVVKGDFKISFFDKDTMGRTKIFTCWLNTSFIKNECIVFPKFSLDGPHHDVKHKIFNAEFSMALNLFPFEESSEEVITDVNNTPFIPDKIVKEEEEDEDDDEEEEEEEEEESKKRPNSILEGYLNVKPKNKTQYKRYFFVLFPTELCYFDAIATKRPKETIFLAHSATMGFIADSETEFWVCPSAADGGRVYDLQAKNNSSRRLWMETIAATILDIQRSRRATSAASPAPLRRGILEDSDSKSREGTSFSAPGRIDLGEDGSVIHNTPSSPQSLAAPFFPSARLSPTFSPATFSPRAAGSPRLSGITPSSPRNTTPSSPRFSPAPTSPLTTTSTLSPESQSLLALRALIQHKQQALANKSPSELQTKDNPDTEMPAISLPPMPAPDEAPVEPASPTNLDSQVMEKLKQIQKLLAAQAV